MAGLCGRTAIVACGLVVSVGVAVVTPPAFAAYPRPGLTTRVSVGVGDAQGNGASTQPVISADARFVAFTSWAANLVPGDTNQVADVFVHDRQTGATTRVSVASDGSEAKAASGQASISADGRFVAFSSLATNLVDDDTNDVRDVFLHDRASGTTTRLSVAADGRPGDGASQWPVLSADGRAVAFTSYATNLVPDDTNEVRDVFVRVLEDGVNHRVSVSSDGDEADASSGDYDRPSAISADGRYVAFTTWATNLVPADTNGHNDVMLHDRDTSTTERVSVSGSGAQGNSFSGEPAISADGSVVAFAGRASFMPYEGTGKTEVFVRDRDRGTTERLSVSSTGELSDGGSWRPSVSADGRYVSFFSGATTLVPEDANAAPDVFVHDRVSGVTELVSATPDGRPGADDASWPRMTPDGRHVVFQSAASDLVSEDTNGQLDVFIRDRGLPLGIVDDLVVAQGSASIGVAGQVTVGPTMLSTATDPADDGLFAAREQGGELTAAQMIFRPEEEDTLIRLRLDSLPRRITTLTSGTGPTGLVYGLSFDTPDGHYELRLQRPSAAGISADTRPPYVGLFRCDVVCSEVARLAGAIGASGIEVLAFVPSTAGPYSVAGQSITGLRAFTAIGEAAAGGLHTVDEMALPDTAVPPIVQVEFGIAPESTPESQVTYTDTTFALKDEFSGSVSVASLPAGSYRLWVRACRGDDCGPPISRAVTL